MHLPPLPDIDPYVNRNLFSDHFLKELLPQDESWQVDQDKLKLAVQALTNLYAGREEEWSSSNEAQLEHRLIRPVLQALDHRFEVQPSLPTADTVSRPDYAFFRTDEERRRAKKEHEGDAEYFRKAIAIGDAKRWDRSLDKKERSGRDSFDMLSPSWQIDYYLRMSGVKWGILTNGRLWRLYNQDTSFRLDICYEIDLPRLLAAKDLEAFKSFYLFLRRQAFVADAEGLSFLDRVYQGSLEYAQAVGGDLKENVYKALRLLAEGFLHTRGNDLDPARDLDEIHGNSLVFLYRLLFVNYAEDRGLLPRDNALYRDSYGLVSMEREIASKVQRRESMPPLQGTYWGKLRTLFDLINQGTEALGIDAETMEVPPYNGGLFDPEKHPFLEQYKVEDRWLAPGIDLLARSQGEGIGRGFVDYSSLDVRHLGSIYEGLLEYKLRVADQAMVAVKRRGKEQWIPAAEVGNTRVLERAEPGSVYLATDRGERKATGSYYTPDYIVKYIVEHTVGPLIEEKMEQDSPIEGILSLKVLDPAMGSGHFLVEATDRLAHGLVRALGEAEQEPEEEDIRWARREVVERCIYGVDLNPLAVELAKLSLWLHTVAEGKPLNFLDHHLKVGNSLIGACVDDLGSLPSPAKKAKPREVDVDARQMNLFEIRLNEQLPVMLGKVLEIIRRRSDTLDDIKAKAAADEAIEESKAPFKAVADLWVSTYFGNQVAQADYQKALEHISRPRALLSLPVVEQAGEIAQDKRFFHWELEFPEVFYEDSKRPANPGFDAVLGNPPYVTTLQRAEREYFFQWSRTRGRELDTFCLFVEQGIGVLRDAGLCSMIVPNVFMLQVEGEALRNHLLRYSILRLTDYGFSVFGEAAVPSAVFVLRKSPAAAEQAVRVRLASGEERRVGQAVFSRLPGAQFNVRIVETLPLLKRLDDVSEPLATYAETHEGVHSGNIRYKLFTREPSLPSARRMLKGSDIGRYCLDWGGWHVNYDPSLIDRDKGEYASLREERLFTNPKIWTRQTGDGIIATWDDEGFYSDNTLHSTQLLPGVHLSPRYVLALLNSRLLTFVYQERTQERGRTLAQVKIVFLRELPIRCIEFATAGGERARLVAEAQALDDTAEHAALLDFVDARLAAEPEQADVIHDVLACLAERMIETNRQKQAEAKGFLGWLARYAGLPIEEWRLKTIVKAYWEHPWDALLRALRQNSKAMQGASGKKVEGRDAQEAIEQEFEKSVARLHPLLQRVARTDRLIDFTVYRLYDLTEEEVAIVEESVTR